MLELKSPKKYDFPSIAVIHPVTYYMTDPTTGVELEKLMNRYFLFQEKLELDQFSNIIKIDTNDPTVEQMTVHYQLQVLMNHCVNSAENINDVLKFFVIQTHAQNIEDEEKLDKKNFMQLRDIFSEYIKKYPRLKEIEGFEKTNTVNLFTKTFYQYILDRNIYTHGQLGYHVQEDAFCIKFLDSEREGYAEIDMLILNSFLEVGKEIKRILDRVIFIQSEDQKR